MDKLSEMEKAMRRFEAKHIYITPEQLFDLLADQCKAQSKEIARLKRELRKARKT